MPYLKRQNGALKITTVFKRSVGNSFYARAINFSQSRLKQNSLSISEKLVCVVLVILCSEVNIFLDAPVAKSIRLNSYSSSMIADTAAKRIQPSITRHATTQKMFTPLEKVSQEISLSFLRGFAYASRYNRFCTIQRALSGSSDRVTKVLVDAPLSHFDYLQYDDRIIPYLRDKLLLILPHGPPLNVLQTSVIRQPTLFPDSVSLTLQKNPTLYKTKKSIFCSLHFSSFINNEKNGPAGKMAFSGNKNAPYPEGFPRPACVLADQVRRHGLKARGRTNVGVGGFFIGGLKGVNRYQWKEVIGCYKGLKGGRMKQQLFKPRSAEKLRS